MLVGAQAAQADAPVVIPVNEQATATDTALCGFPVDISSTITGTERDFYRADGTPTNVILHLVEQDTFTANGHTLVGLSYPNQIHIPFDSSGLPQHIYATGPVSRVPLPGGKTFFSAGRIDVFNHPNTGFFFVPDIGHSGDVAAFCAALAP
jgi:hypothetical protein